MERRAFTRRANGRVSEIRTDVGIFVVANAQQIIPPKIEAFNAIWDTGATNTAITSAVVQKLGLKPITFAQVGTGAGQVTAPVYLVNIVLPDNFMVPNVRVTELQVNNADVLIGMDIISQGDFAITHHEGKACFSFRIPSMGDVDFVPETVEHNKFVRSKAGQVIEMAKARRANRSSRKKASKHKSPTSKKRNTKK